MQFGPMGVWSPWTGEGSSPPRWSLCFGRSSRTDDGYQPGISIRFFEADARRNRDQICEYKDGTKYESSGMTWTYRGDGNVHLSPLKDCSWVWGELMDRGEGSLETPQGGASLVVEWGRNPVILMHPDINAFYEWQGPAK